MGDKGDGHLQKTQYNSEQIVSLHCFWQCSPMEVQAWHEGQMDIQYVGTIHVGSQV